MFDKFGNLDINEAVLYLRSLVMNPLARENVVEPTTIETIPGNSVENSVETAEENQSLSLAQTYLKDIQATFGNFTTISWNFSFDEKVITPEQEDLEYEIEDLDGFMNFLLNTATITSICEGIAKELEGGENVLIVANGIFLKKEVENTFKAYLALIV